MVDLECNFDYKCALVAAISQAFKIGVVKPDEQVFAMIVWDIRQACTKDSKGGSTLSVNKGQEPWPHMLPRNRLKIRCAC